MLPAPNYWYFNLVDEDNSKSVFLNDFRSKVKVILQSNFLDLLYCGLVQVPTSAMYFVVEPVCSEDVSLFGTSKCKVRKYGRTIIDDVKADEMDPKWKVLIFRNQFDVKKCCNINPHPCARKRLNKNYQNVELRQNQKPPNHYFEW